MFGSDWEYIDSARMLSLLPPVPQYRDGLELFGEADEHLLPDLLHPNGEGYELMGQCVMHPADLVFHSFASNVGKLVLMFYRRFAAMEFGPRGRLVAGRFGGSPKL